MQIVLLSVYLVVGLTIFIAIIMDQLRLFCFV